MKLNISDLGIVSISILENVLIFIDVNGNKKEYDASNIKELRCSGNHLTSLTSVPKGLEILYCSRNQLTSLPKLPEGLKNLSCYGNQLTFLPKLPKGLKSLYCFENQITSLPKLPEGLKNLSCFGNQLTSLPKLPEGLKGLNCNGNHLTSLPVIPKELKALDCSGNRLVYVQYLRMRPWSYIVPKSLKKKHSKRYYQKNYVLQTLSRYLVCFFTYRSKYCNTFRIFETILSETLL